MNLLLLDPFSVAKEYPETLTSTLQFSHSRYIKFNKNGDYLASGLLDGTLAIFDYDTNQVVCTLKAHTSVIQSIQWSRCGRYILLGAGDGRVILWDLKTKKKIREVMFESPVWYAEMSPYDLYEFVASVFHEDPVWCNWRDEQQMTKIPNEPDHGVCLCITYGFEGRYIFMGTSKGWLNVKDARTLVTIYQQKICASHLKQIFVSLLNFKIFVNSSDRVIRQLSIPEDFTLGLDEWVKSGEEFEVEHKYQDMVNRLQWNSIGTNHNGDYLIASTYGSGAHDVYMWETTMGLLIKVLEGPKEELYDIDWNHKRCCIGANGLDSGCIYLWTNVIPQKWSALAPDFAEVDENIEYDEREDEFDIRDEEDTQRQLNIEDERVDIVTKDEVDARGMRQLESFVIEVKIENVIEADDDSDDE